MSQINLRWVPAVTGTMVLWAYFCRVAVNAEAFGLRDAGIALFLALAGALTLTALLWSIPVLALAAAIAWLTRRASPVPLLLATLVATLPFIV